ncbi:ABC transporter ATP-binding protein [Rubneribacter sp.]
MSTLLSTEDVCLSFKGKRVLDHLSFSVARGECFGFLGPSGAGKTTTIKLLTRQLTKDSGRISLFGRPIEHATNADYERIGILSDTSALYERMSIEDNLRFYAKIRGVTGNNIPTLLERMGLASDRKTLVKNCSKGMRQRAALLAALVHGPELLFLDEPTSGLDPAARAEVHKMLRELKGAGVTVFLTTHDMAEAEELCDRVGILNEGSLAACDAPDALRLRFARNEVIVRLADGRILRTTKDESGAKEVAQALASGACLSIHSVEPDLEEVFLELTGREF